MSIILDIAVLVVIIYFASSGIRKGGVKSIFSMLAFFAAAVITALIYKPCSQFLMELPVAQTLGDKIGETIAGGGNEVVATEAMAVSKGVQEFLAKTQADFMNSISASLTSLVLSILCIAVIYIAVRIILGFVIKILDSVMKLPVLKSMNKLLGLIFGSLKGLFVVFGVLALIHVFTPFAFFAKWNEAIQQTTITTILYNNNFLLDFFLGF